VDELTAFRARIDHLDDQLVGLLASRFAVCDGVARWKAESGVDVMQPGRVEEVKERAARAATANGLRPEFVRELFSLIIAEACRIEDAVLDSLRAGH
jgi:chorismate mutase